jgi:hypothetical protein
MLPVDVPTPEVRRSPKLRARSEWFWCAEHINVTGKYSFTAPDLPDGTTRQLRDPDARDDEEDFDEDDTW